MRALKGCCRRLCGKKLAGNAKQETPQSGAAGADGEWLEDAGWDDVEGGTAAPSVATPLSSTATTTTAPRSRGLRMDRAVARDKKDRVAADGARVGDGAVPINMQSNATEEDGDASELFASLGLDATYKRPKKHMDIDDQPADEMVVNADGLRMTVWTSKAKKFTSGAEQSMYLHLNFKMEHGVPQGARGLLAELAGDAPMSEATRAMFKQGRQGGRPLQPSE